MDDVDVHMDLSGLVLVLEAEGNELIGAHDPIDEVGASLNHTLVDQLAERLVLADIAKVVEELVPEAGIY